MLLDTSTAYGTQLLLSFSNRRLDFDSINVVDPLYTIPLIIGLVLSLWVYKSKSNRSIFNHYGLTMPVGIASMNWDGVAKGQDSIYMMKYNVFSNNNKPIEAFPINEAYLNQIDKNVADKMRWFAKGFYTVKKENGRIRIYNLQVDMRGTITTGNKKAPTVGYFEISKSNDKTIFSSGSIKN